MRAVVRLGGRFLVLIDDVYSDLFTGEVLAPPDLDDRLWGRSSTTTNADRRGRRRPGSRLVFHPHAETHVEYEAQIERFLADTDDRESACVSIPAITPIAAAIRSHSSAATTPDSATCT